MVQCSSATYIRKTVQNQLAAGKSEDDIVATFVGQYGPRILAEPPKSGFSLSAWIMPFFVLILGGAFLSYFLWQWKAKFQPAAVGSAVAGVEGVTPGEGVLPAGQNSPSLVEKYRAQIDKELEND
jgi:cytochrome c-type biogenesis protein CcmH